MSLFPVGPCLPNQNPPIVDFFNIYDCDTMVNWTGILGQFECLPSIFDFIGKWPQFWHISHFAGIWGQIFKLTTNCGYKRKMSTMVALWSSWLTFQANFWRLPWIVDTNGKFKIDDRFCLSSLAKFKSIIIQVYCAWKKPIWFVLRLVEANLPLYM